MPKIIYLDPQGNRHEFEVASGYTVMEGAIDNNVPGIVAECGGACACATCHAYVAEEWADKLPEMDEMEDAMLDSAADRRATSRLTCQLEVTQDMDGLTVTVADNDV